MIIFVVSEKDLFDSNQNDRIENCGEVVFLDKDTYIENIICNNEEKVIVYDPDFGGWNFPNEILENANNLKAIFLGTTDKSYIDLDYCESKSIKVFNIPRYAADSVAEYLVMYMFCLAKKIPLQIKNNNSQDFTPEYEQIQLKGKKVGIVGFGNIGSRIANICNGIGMNVCYWNRNKKDNEYEYLSLDGLFSTCDVIYLCLSINDETKNLITDQLLNKLKKSCIFISCTGKSLFNSNIIEEKVRNNELYGYALEEPNTSINKYEGNIMVTSEYAWFTKEANEARMNLWTEIIVDTLSK